MAPDVDHIVPLESLKIFSSTTQLTKHEIDAGVLSSGSVYHLDQKNIDTILVLDFGSQYTQLIARRVRELNIYSEIHPFNKIPKGLDSFKALILSGSPYSVREADSPRINLSLIHI